MNTLRNKISIILKILIIIFVILGITFNSIQNENNFMGGITAYLYFTIQSNIWILITSLLGLIIILLSIINNTSYYKPYMLKIKLVFTVSITLTGFVFSFVLAPFMSKYFNIWGFNNVTTHLIVPVLAIIDLYVFEYNYKYKNKDILYTLIPPLYYLGFSLIGYINNWNFGQNNNYPYFFLNYNSPAKIFGFSNVSPYYIGSFYWIILLTLFVLGLAYLYIKSLNKIKNNHSI